MLSGFSASCLVLMRQDARLQFHFTKEPLLEEYSIAAQIYKFSPADMCELARNSVIQSGFEMSIKRHWHVPAGMPLCIVLAHTVFSRLGHHWYRSGVEGNVIHKTNVPDVRMQFRHSTLLEEQSMVWRYAGRVGPAPGSGLAPIWDAPTKPLSQGSEEARRRASHSLRQKPSMPRMAADGTTVAMAAMQLEGGDIRCALAWSSVVLFLTSSHSVHPGASFLAQREGRPRSRSKPSGAEADAA